MTSPMAFALIATRKQRGKSTDLINRAPCRDMSKAIEIAERDHEFGYRTTKKIEVRPVKTQEETTDYDLKERNKK